MWAMNEGEGNADVESVSSAKGRGFVLWRQCPRYECRCNVFSFNENVVVVLR